MSAPAQRLELGRIGESVKRVDAIPKVTGEFAYASDLFAAGMLWGHTLRSPHAHARIVGVDISQALAMAGVHAVLTHADVPGAKTYGLEFADQPVLSIDRVRYFGEPVALVAAEHPEQARRAAEKIVVEYELLDPVVDPERATEQAPIHDENPTAGHGFREDPRPNVLRSIVVRHGDPDTEGDVSVSGVYELGIQDHAFLGPESGLAVPDGEGGVDVYVATQWLHVDRDQVAPCLGLEKEQVRLHLAGVGGAFGGREDLSMQVHAAMLALHTDRPVKMVYGREESFVGHIHRHPAKIWMEHRATREGKLVCVRMRILLDGGAYASSSTAVCSNAASFACGPYAVPNALLEATALYTNNPPCGAMRGFGAVQTCFAAEAQMDKLADTLGIDRVELRLLNALAPGDTLPTGQRIDGSLPTAEVIRRAAALEPPPPEELPRDPLRLPGGAGRQRVEEPELDGVDVERGRQPVHLRLGGEAGLHRAEAAHRSARRVVREHRGRLDQRVGDAVRPARERGRVGGDGGRAGRVRPAVEQDPHAHADEPAVPGRAMLRVDPRGVAMDVPREGLLPAVDHLHGAAGVQREHRRVDLHRQVLAAAEGAADAGQVQAHPLLGEAEARRDLLAVAVQPLRRRVDVDAPLAVRDRDTRLGAEKRLILLTEVVHALDHHVTLSVRVAAPDHHRPDDVRP